MEKINYPTTSGGKKQMEKDGEKMMTDEQKKLSEVRAEGYFLGEEKAKANEGGESFKYEKSPLLGKAAKDAAIALEDFNKLKSEAIQDTKKIAEKYEVEISEIAFGPNEINENTKVYIGKWNMETFLKVKNYPNVRHIQERSNGDEIIMCELETDPKINSSESAEKELINNNIELLSSFSSSTQDILQKTEFSSEKKSYNLVMFSMGQLGLSMQGDTTLDEIYKKAQELELDLCPAEVGPLLVLKLQNNIRNIHPNTKIAMERINDCDEYPRIFSMNWNWKEKRPKLEIDAAPLDATYLGTEYFVFSFRK